MCIRDRDAFALLRPYDDMRVEDINRFTKDDVVCALEMFNEDYVTCLLYTSTAAAAQALHAGTIQQQLITGEAGTDQQEPEQKKSWVSASGKVWRKKIPQQRRG